MRILIGHNFYREFGGEDNVVKAESSLLKNFKEDVYFYEKNNSEFNSGSIIKKASQIFNLTYSRSSYKDIKRIIREFRPDIAHFHNIFYLITPSVYFACQEEGVPVVQTLHNYRMLCSNGLFYRNNMVCEECLNNSLWRGVLHRCYKNSRFLTALVAWSIYRNRQNNAWTKKVDHFIASSDFVRQKHIQGGIQAECDQLNYWV